MREQSSEFDPVDVLVDEFLDRYRRGEQPSLTELVRKHPEHAERLRSLVPAMLVMEEFGPGSADSSLASSLARMPQRLGDYVLIRPLGSGGMGVVYEAIQESLGRHVALKTVPSHQPDDANRLERFRREALAAAKLQHAHIVPVFGVGEHEGLHFYTMQFIDGHGLDLVLRQVDRLRRDPDSDDVRAGELSSDLAWGLWLGHFVPQPPAGVDAKSAAGTPRANRPSPPHRTGARYLLSVARIGAQVAEALEYAHGQGVLHRDIKPSNLLLDAQGHVWITDFGLAKTADRDELTRTGDVVGTLRYMAPERFSGWSDPRSDIFALGATLYELLAFRPAFDEPDRIKLIDRLLHGSPTPLRQLDRRFPRDLETIVLKALANASGERYATAGQMADDLRRFVAGRPILARRSNVIERAWRWGRRNPAGAAAVIVVAAALAATLAMSMIYAHDQGKAADKVRALAVDLANERESLKISLTESRRILATRDFDRGLAAFEKDQASPGLLWLMAAWRSAIDAGDVAWQRVALANLSAWLAYLPRITGVLSHEGPVDAAAFSPDGKTILTGGDDFVARLWNADTAVPIGKPLPHPGTVFSLAFAPDGKTVLTGAGDGEARFWDTATRQPLGPPLHHGGEITAVVFSPDGKTVLTGGTDNTARLWNADTRQPIGAPLVVRRAITGAAFHPWDNVVATASRDFTVRLWNATDGRPTSPPLQHNGEVLALAFSPDGATLLAGGSGGAAQVWHLDNPQQLGGQWRPHRGHVRCVAFSPDGTMILTGSEDKSARLWDTATRQPLGPPLLHQGPVVAVAFRADGKALLTASSDHTVRVWDAASCQYPGPTLEKSGAGQAVAFAPDGQTFFSTDGSTVRHWNVVAGGQIGRDITCGTSALSIAPSPDGKTILVGGNPAQLWDATTRWPWMQSLDHPGGAAVVAFHPDGKMVATGGADRTTRLWDAVTGESIGTPIDHPGTVDALAFRPDGKALLAGYDSGAAQAWNVTTRTPVGPALRHPGAVSSVAFNTSGTSVVTGCEDGAARIWDARTGALRVPPLAHGAWVFAVAFSPDGATVLSGSRDQTVRLWDTATGQPIGPPLAHTSQLWSVGFASDGKSILTGEISGIARVFALPPPLPNDPAQVAAWIEVLTGLRLDESQGSIQTLDNATWRATRDRLKPSMWTGPKRETQRSHPSVGLDTKGRR